MPKRVKEVEEYDSAYLESNPDVKEALWVVWTIALCEEQAIDLPTVTEWEELRLNHVKRPDQTPLQTIGGLLDYREKLEKEKADEEQAKKDREAQLAIETEVNKPFPSTVPVTIKPPNPDMDP